MIDFKVYNTNFFYLEFLIGISPAGGFSAWSSKKNNHVAPSPVVQH